MVQKCACLVTYSGSSQSDKSTVQGMLICQCSSLGSQFKLKCLGNMLLGNMKVGYVIIETKSHPAASLSLLKLYVSQTAEMCMAI